MRKFMLMGALVALVVAALALPALAQNHDFFRGNQAAFDGNGFFAADNQEDRLDARQDRLEERADRFQERLEDRSEEQGLFFGADRLAEARDWWNGQGWFWSDDWNDDPAVGQTFNQQAESGDVNQSFNVSNRGDNSNQCVGISGVANTGNAQNQVGVIQYGSESDDFDFEDSGASINVGGSSTTRCDQQVNQAAAAG